MNNIFLQLALVLSLASAIGYVVYRLKFPLVVAYLLSGVLITLFHFFNPHDSLLFGVLPDLGIALVLFLIGMELDLREVKALGGPIILSALGQIFISTLAGYAIAGFLGFSPVESVYLGLGLAFSSTVVVVKLLLEKRDLNSLYGKLSVGILLLEDLVAIAALMFISLNSSVFHLGLNNSFPLVKIVLSALLLFGLTYLLSRYVLEKIFDEVAKSVELLFLTAITWCFLFTALAVMMGFSVVIGAFLAGVALASSPYHLQIQGKIKPLRDFFLTLFFIYLGLQARVSDLAQAWPAILVFTAYALIVKPLIYLLILGTFGFRKHTLFQTSLNLSQISEFSLVVLLVGKQSGVISDVALSAMAAVGVLSIIFSSIMIEYSHKIYQLLAPFLRFFEHPEKVHHLESRLEEEIEDHVIVIGAHRVGGPVVEYLQNTKIPLVVMDFNPHIVEKLRKDGVKVIYGDVGDPEILDNLRLEKARLIICTANDFADNELLLEECKRRRVQAKIVARATEPSQARILKQMGADYVILPEQVSGDFLVSQLRTHWPKVHFNGLS